MVLSKDDRAFLRKLLAAFYSSSMSSRYNPEISEEIVTFKIEQEVEERIQRIFNENTSISQAFLELFQMS